MIRFTDYRIRSSPLGHLMTKEELKDYIKNYTLKTGDKKIILSRLYWVFRNVDTNEYVLGTRGDTEQELTLGDVDGFCKANKKVNERVICFLSENLAADFKIFRYSMLTKDPHYIMEVSEYYTEVYD